MKKKIVAKHSETPEMAVKYPTSEEIRALGSRCQALSESVKQRAGFMGVAAFRAAMDLDYLARLIDADPVKHIGQWQVVVTLAKPKKSKKPVT